MNHSLASEIVTAQRRADMPINLIIQRLGWKLVRNNGRGDVQHGDQFHIHNGGLVTVIGGTPPMRDGSTGRIVVRVDESDGSFENEFYPGVCDLSWVRL